MSRQPPRDPLAIAARLRDRSIHAIAHSDRAVLRAHLATVTPAERVRLRFTSDALGNDLAQWAMEQMHDMLARDLTAEEHEALAALCEEAALFLREIAHPEPRTPTTP